MPEIATIDYAPPPAAIPLPELRPTIDLKKDYSGGGRKSSLEIDIERSERARTQELFLKQRQAEQLREAEVWRRESDRREKLWKSIQGHGLDTKPRITSRTPDWERSYSSPPQNRPAPAAAPATPRTSGVVEVEFADRPPPAELRIATKAPNPQPLARPSSLPIPPARTLIYPGIMAAADFGFRIVAGQPIQQALVGTTASVGGSIAGSVVGTAVAGPIGGFTGGILGGFVGGKIADLIFQSSQPKNAENVTPDPVTGIPPFQGGQGNGIAYKIVLLLKYYLSPDRKSTYTFGEYIGNLYGPISNFRNVIDRGVIAYATFRGPAGPYDQPTPPVDQVLADAGKGSFGGFFEIVSISRKDGLPDTGGNPPPLPIPKDKRPPDSKNHPLNINTAPPRATPAASNPQSSPTTPQNYIPGGLKSREGGNQRGDSPNWVPHNAPKGSPHPVNQPQPLLKLLPETGRLPDSSLLHPSNNQDPKNASPTTIKAHEAIPNSNNPSGKNTPQPSSPITLKFPSGAPVTTTIGNTPIPDALKPVPKTSQPTGTGLKPKESELDRKIADLEKQLKDGNSRLIEVMTGLTAISTVVTSAYQNTTPEKLEPIIEKSVCKTTQPGGCSINAMNDVAGKSNQDLKNWLANNGLDAANLALGKDTNTRVRNIEEKTGSNEYPMILPEYLLDDYLDKQVIITNQVQYNAWLLKQIDALVGLFPIKIERTDEDGNKQTLVFENIAEAIAEITGLLAQIAFDADTAVNISTRATGEAIGAKAAALQAGSLIKAIIDYMGFQGQSVSFDVPISVTPGAVGLDGKLQENELKDFLKPSTQKAIGFKNTDPVDQRLVLRRILESGEISRAALFRPLKPNQAQNPLTGDAIKSDKTDEKKRLDNEWDALVKRLESHTKGTRVDIDEGDKDTTP